MTESAEKVLGERRYPSGAAKRKLKKQREAEELAAHAERVARGDSPGSFDVPENPSMSEIHLRQLEQLWRAQALMLKDETTPLASRVRLILAVSHAIAKLSTQAQQEADLVELKARSVRREDELREAKAATLRERHALQQERAALKAEREKLGLSTPVSPAQSLPR